MGSNIPFEFLAYARDILKSDPEAVKKLQRSMGAAANLALREKGLVNEGTGSEPHSGNEKTGKHDN